MSPGPGRRSFRAISRAWSTSSSRMCGSRVHRTTRRECRSKIARPPRQVCNSLCLPKLECRSRFEVRAQGLTAQITPRQRPCHPESRSANLQPRSSDHLATGQSYHDLAHRAIGLPGCPGPRQSPSAGAPRAQRSVAANPDALPIGAGSQRECRFWS